jgi:hypothetical protein
MGWSTNITTEENARRHESNRHKSNVIYFLLKGMLYRTGKQNTLTEEWVRLWRKLYKITYTPNLEVISGEIEYDYILSRIELFITKFMKITLTNKLPCADLSLRLFTKKYLSKYTRNYENTVKMANAEVEPSLGKCEQEISTERNLPDLV